MKEVKLPYFLPDPTGLRLSSSITIDLLHPIVSVSFILNTPRNPVFLHKVSQKLFIRLSLLCKL